jgi:hypothetical protein
MPRSVPKKVFVYWEVPLNDAPFLMTVETIEEVPDDTTLITEYTRGESFEIKRSFNLEQIERIEE